MEYSSDEILKGQFNINQNLETKKEANNLVNEGVSTAITLPNNQTRQTNQEPSQLQTNLIIQGNSEEGQLNNSNNTISPEVNKRENNPKKNRRKTRKSKRTKKKRTKVKRILGKINTKSFSQFIYSLNHMNQVINYIIDSGLDEYGYFKDLREEMMKIFDKIVEEKLKNLEKNEKTEEIINFD